MRLKAGFIGAGNMGSALLQAVAKLAGGENIAVFDPDTAKTERLAEEFGCAVLHSSEIVKNAEYIFLAIKPQMYETVLTPLVSAFSENENGIIVTMAAGLSAAAVKQLSGNKNGVIRIMPNTPAAVGSGMMLYCADSDVSAPKIEEFKKMMAASGELLELPEALIDAGSCISGCGPAFVYEFIHALALGGESCGLSYKDAVVLAAQTAKGAAEMVLKTSKPCDELCNNVCSPGGTTIEGVKHLRSADLEGVVKGAVKASYNRTLELKK